MTIVEYYLALPREYRDRAIANCNEKNKNKEVPSLSEAIRLGFSWSASPENSDFWLRTYEELDGQAEDCMNFDDLPPIPK